MKAWLILADGTIYEGTSIGATGKTIGETVFTTGMTGYLETLTDPSYFGQIVTQTFPLIGNYGDIPQDYESKKSWVRGYIVRELCDLPSNFRCKGTLSDFLKAQNIVGICGIDTRALTKRLRESGVMNGMIISGEESKKILKQVQDEGVLHNGQNNCHAALVSASILDEIKAYKIEQAVESVQDNQIENCHSELSSAAIKQIPNQVRNDGTSPHIVLWDFGAKANIQRELEKRGCQVTVVPCTTKADEILALKPDGLMLSNGPGDPADNVQIIEELKKICEYDKKNLEQFQADVIPIFGICLGHQMLALAHGCKTSKLKYGHRGGNHPCKDIESGRVYITSQNHGYAVENTSLPSYAKMSFFNVNDGTVEGISYTDIPAFSVQFHPEACGGPHDTNFLFDNFLARIQEHQNAIKQ